MKQFTTTGNNSKRNFRWYMRFLHNQVGFFITGLVIIYSLSGIIQTYRDSNFLKHQIKNEKLLSPGLDEAKLGPLVKQRDFKVSKTVGDTLFFKDGQYNRHTGTASFTTMEWYSWIAPFTDLHKTASKNVLHYFTTVFAVCLFFMSVSAFWMFKPGTRPFSRGVLLTIAGIIASVLLLIFH